MCKKQNSLDFSITTSCEYWEQKTYEQIKKSTYLDPLYDAAFKAFLGEEMALKSFLNGVFHLDAEHQIAHFYSKASMNRIRTFLTIFLNFQLKRNAKNAKIAAIGFHPPSSFGFATFLWKNKTDFAARGVSKTKRACR